MSTITKNDEEKLIYSTPFLEKAAEKSPITNSELQFLETLQKEILKIDHISGGRVYGPGINHNWKRKCTNDEFKKVISIIEKRTNLIVCPVSTNMGFTVSFFVYMFTFKIIPQRNIVPVKIFSFSSQSLPEKEDMEKLFKKICDTDVNRTKVKDVLGKTVQSYGHYEY